MKTHQDSKHFGFTLLETVIAIGVLAVLLTGFMVVFAPAAEGIRKSINVQQADRMASTLEQELVTPRDNEPTGFDKAFNWIRDSDKLTGALAVYQYRGRPSDLRPDDNTPKPEPSLDGKSPGKDYIVVPMVRRLNDTKFKEDLSAIEGAVYVVKCSQLVFNNGELKVGTPGVIIDPKGSAPAPTSEVYPEAVVAFAADFYLMPAKSDNYFKSPAFTAKFPDLKSPVFTRNLAVRR